MITKYALDALHNVISTLGGRVLASKAGRSGIESSFHLSVAMALDNLYQILVSSSVIEK